MARIVPDPAVATTLHSFRVRFCETDLMGIVHHSNYLQYFEAGRVEWLRRRGILYAEWTSNGIHTAVVEAVTKYHSPAKFDEELTCATTLAEMGGASLVYSYRLSKGETLVASGHTRLACVDTWQKLTKMPREMRDVLLVAERTTGP
jgi:acyl-CoA thioester hydrolase